MSFIKSLMGLAALTAAMWAHGQSPSVSWSGVYTFSSPASQQQKLTQADLIAKREAGYYDNIGKTVVTNYSTTVIGTINENTTTVEVVGDGQATVINSSTNSGSLNGSITTIGASVGSGSLDISGDVQ